MKKKEIQEYLLFETYTIDSTGEELICFDLSDDLAYFSPYRIENDKVIIEIDKKVYVYERYGYGEEGNPIIETLYNKVDIWGADDNEI